MKDTYLKIKWILRQARPFAFLLTLTIILGTLSSLLGVSRALVSKKLIDAATASKAHNIIQYLIIFALLILTEVGLRALLSIVPARNSAEISNSIQRKLYTRLTQIRWLEVSRYHSGDVLTRMTNDVEVITALLISTVPNIITLAVTLAASFVTILFFQPSLAVLTLLIGPISIILSRFYGRRLKKLYAQKQKIESDYRSFLHESIQNMAIVKSFSLEEINLSHINNLQKDRLNLILRGIRMSAASNSVLSLSSWIGTFLVLSWGAFSISKGVATFGTLTALLQLVGNIQGPFAGLASSFPQIISSVASAERLMEFEKLELDINIPNEINMDSAGIQFEHVSFGYKKDSAVIKDVSVLIHPGETVALIGTSGEGKTTLIRLLLYLVSPERGHVYITNNNKQFDINVSTRKLISYVPQGNTIFSGTIADNLRCGYPDATDSQLEEAARAACAWNFINSLPDGLYTVVGEHGLGLSEGQAQRIAIARAILRKAPILILDEAASALDTATEVNVLEAIHKLRPVRTCIIITHRPSALRICNRILKLESGHISEQLEHVALDIDITKEN